MRFPTVSSHARGEQRLVHGTIDAVVVDEHDQPLEKITGAQTLTISADEMAIRAPYPLMPGLKLVVLVNDPHAPGLPPKQLELQVLTCHPRLGAHWVETRILNRRPAATPRLAA
jgi:hypothetical protein